ncbi:hypothetical protein V1264_008801 [Littorina saxatilis]|uniref:EGF-like domain-containing protein n=1 Tax=Littorina saxatilis TaxID=31220 RepID=A0AAN9ATT3_9CAEN
MVTMTGTALWAALFLLTAHTAYGQNDTTYDYDSNEFNNGSCSYKKLNCATGSLCVQNPGHTRFKCFCPDGYAGDGYLEEFKTGATGCELVGGPVLCTSSNDCNEYADCNPIDDLRSQCVCRDGFTGSGAIDNGCTDIAECEGNPCAENANCYEEPGGFTCECDSARNYEGDGYVKCTWICYSHQDCAPHGRCNGNRTCECDTGFTGDGRSCTDIDECTNGDSDCPDKSTCNNTPGSFQCVCANGYEYKDKTCVPYYQTCDAIYTANRNRLSNGRYTIDLDFEGPLPAIEVDCYEKDGVAITEIAPTESFPQTVPKTGGDKPVQYPIDPTPLINNSDFCSQRVWLQCTNKLTGGMIRWEDRQGRKRKGWGSTKDGVCGCGQFRKCPNGCNCGFGAEGEDEGLIVDKDQLPVSKVTFPALNTANAGNYIVGPLRCGPKPFDIPRDCHEARFKYKVKNNQPLVIDIDGDGPNRPFLVYCNQEAYSHVGIIEIPPDQLVISRTPAEGSSVEYLIPGPDVNNAINGSVFCSQRVEYECSSDTMTAAGVKVETRSGVLNYFPGGSNDQPGSCGCGLTNSCEDKRFKCNCNIGDGKARKDQGLIINRSRLPVLKVKSTSSDNFYKIGPLQCSRFQFGIEPNCEKLRQSDVTETYSYRIDPDGPGNLEPFTAQCEMDANKGVTVINNENGGGLNLASGKSFSINYLAASPAQLTALKDRSTSCVQSVTFTGCSGDSVSIDGITYNSGKPLNDVLRGPCKGTSCKCDSPINAIAKDKLPIYEIKGGSARVTIGPLRCTEIFPDCESYATFIGQEGVLGETKIAKDVLTIDPDGPGDGEPFVVRCIFRETVVPKPTTPGEGGERG